MPDYILFKPENSIPYYQFRNEVYNTSYHSGPIVDINSKINLPGFFNPTSSTNTTYTDARLGGYYSSNNGASWTHYKDINDITTGIGNVQVVIDSLGIYHYFVSIGTSLKQFKFDGTNWSLFATHTMPVSSYNLIVKMGINDTISLLFQDKVTYPNAQYIEYATISSSGILSSFSVIYDNHNYLLRNMDMCVGVDGVVHVVTGNANASTCIYMNSITNWTPEVTGIALYQGNYGGLGPKIAVHGSVVHVVTGLFVYPSSGLMYAYKDTTWHVKNIVTPAYSPPYYITPFITFDVDDNIYVSFIQTPNTDSSVNHLYYVKRTISGNWETRVLVATITGAYDFMMNLGFFDNNNLPFVPVGTGVGYEGYGIAKTGCRGMFRVPSSNSALATGYYLWSSDDLVLNEIDLLATPGCANVYGTINSGIDHLEGLDVAVLADGEVVHDVVVEDGAIDVQAAEIKVGLPYTSEMETLNIDIDTQLGTLQGRHVKVSEVTYRILETRGGFIGPNKDTTYEAFTEENLEKATPIADAIGVDPKLYNVDVRLPLGASYERGGRMYYKQEDPLPVTIGAIIPEVTA